MCLVLTCEQGLTLTDTIGTFCYICCFSLTSDEQCTCLAHFAWYRTHSQDVHCIYLVLVFCFFNVDNEPIPRWELGFEERVVYLHADNSVQGGARITSIDSAMAYTHRLVLRGHLSPFWLLVTPSRLLTAWCFGLFKCLCRWTNVHVCSLKDAAELMMAVPAHNWSNHFAPNFKKLSSIKYHFKMSSFNCGAVLVKEHTDSPEVEVNPNKWSVFNALAHLTKIRWPSWDFFFLPQGLNAEHQWYWYKQIHPFWKCHSWYSCQLPSAQLCPMNGQNG